MDRTTFEMCASKLYAQSVAWSRQMARFEGPEDIAQRAWVALTRKFNAGKLDHVDSESDFRLELRRECARQGARAQHASLAKMRDERVTEHLEWPENVFVDRTEPSQDVDYVEWLLKHTGMIDMAAEIIEGLTLGMSQSDIAREYGKPPAYVGRRIKKVREAINSALEAD